jgi:hypothetical protein
MNNPIIIYIGLAIIVFIICREILTWYFKINKIVNLLERIEKNTRIPEKKEETPSTNPVSKDQPTGGVWRDGKWSDK